MILDSTQFRFLQLMDSFCCRTYLTTQGEGRNDSGISVMVYKEWSVDEFSSVAKIRKDTLVVMGICGKHISKDKKCFSFNAIMTRNIKKRPLTVESA